MAGRRSLLGSLLVVVAALAGRVASGTPNPSALDGFRALMDEAVARMHAAMDVPYTGDVDADFARMMLPHHQGAIDMASLDLRLRKDERLKRLAQEIIVTQQQEIAVMRLAVGDARSPRIPAPATGSWRWSRSAPTA